MLAVLVAVLLVLQGLVAVVTAGPAVASGYHGFIHCITGRADEANTRSGALLFHGSSCRADQAESPVAIIPDRVALVLPAIVSAIVPAPRLAAHIVPRRARQISEPRAPPISV